MMTVPKLFRTDAHGQAIPMITEGCEWVLSTDNGIMTIKLDGVQVKVEFDVNHWKISKAMGDSRWMATHRDDQPEIWRAFENLDVKNIGVYEVYGKGINGNPHEISDTFMIKVFPVDYTLIVAKGNTKVLRGPTQTVKMLYDNIKAELMESPEIEGFVFHLEGPEMKLQSACKVRKKDFGIAWPAKMVNLLPPATA